MKRRVFVVLGGLKGATSRSSCVLDECFGRDCEILALGGMSERHHKPEVTFPKFGVLWVTLQKVTFEPTEDYQGKSNTIGDVIVPYFKENGAKRRGKRRLVTL
ncbi:hypothetical protein CPB85DRAFT_1258508 [Mucidula mucida]|nr:hypothetical protein CPB85DRAFT_1258508 [Mucidula mucida]